MDVKMKGYTRKHILRESIGRKLPGRLLRAQKRGFNVPLRTWLASGTENVITARGRACTKAGIFDGDALESVIQMHTNGGRDAGNALWAAAMLSYAI